MRFKSGTSSVLGDYGSMEGVEFETEAILSDYSSGPQADSPETVASGTS